MDGESLKAEPAGYPSTMQKRYDDETWSSDQVLFFCSFFQKTGKWHPLKYITFEKSEKGPEK